MNTPNEIRIDNPQFLKKQPSIYDCFMLLGKSYLSYALLDESHNLVLAVRHYDFKDQVIGKNDFDTIFGDKHLQKAKKFHLGIQSQKRTLVPTSLYDADNKNSYFKHQFEIEDNETIFEMPLSQQKVVSLFALKNDSVAFFKNRLNNISFHDAAASVLKTYPQHSLDSSNSNLFLSISQEATTITLYHQKKIYLHKSFPNLKEADILFVVLHSLSQFSIPAGEVDIHLHGEGTLVNDLDKVMQGRFASVTFLNRIHEISYPEELFAQPSYYFFNLFSLVSCVS